VLYQQRALQLQQESYQAQCAGNQVLLQQCHVRHQELMHAVQDHQCSWQAARTSVTGKLGYVKQNLDVLRWLDQQGCKFQQTPAVEALPMEEPEPEPEPKKAAAGTKAAEVVTTAVPAPPVMMAMPCETTDQLQLLPSARRAGRASSGYKGVYKMRNGIFWAWESQGRKTTGFLSADEATLAFAQFKEIVGIMVMNKQPRELAGVAESQVV
jgi:hypothetical protein